MYFFFQRQSAARLINFSSFSTDHNVKAAFMYYYMLMRILNKHLSISPNLTTEANWWKLLKYILLGHACIVHRLSWLALQLLHFFARKTTSFLSFHHCHSTNPSFVLRLKESVPLGVLLLMLLWSSCCEMYKVKVALHFFPGFPPVLGSSWKVSVLLYISYTKVNFRCKMYPVYILFMQVCLLKLYITHVKVKLLAWICCAYPSPPITQPVV